jgi:tetratricopeptide (TPR) repeat protein
LGADRTETLGDMIALGSAYFNAGRSQDAIRVLETAVKLKVEKRQGHWPDTVTARDFLAAGYRADGRWAAAEAQYLEMLKIQRKSRNNYGPEHHETLRTMSNLAGLYHDLGQYAKAELLSTQALEAARRKLGGDHPKTAWLMGTLGSVLLKEQKYAEAESILRECAAIRARIMPDDWGRFSAESALGGSLLGQKRYSEAESLILAGYEGMKAREAKIEAHNKARLHEAEERIVQLYEAWGQPEKAAAWKARLGLAGLPEDVFARP